MNKEKFGHESEEMKAFVKIIQEQDSINVIKVTHILDKRGWLGADIIGNEGNLTLFLVFIYLNNMQSILNIADEETDHRVPLVEMKTTNSIRYYTDNNGIIAFYEPDLMKQEVYSVVYNQIIHMNGICRLLGAFCPGEA